MGTRKSATQVAGFFAFDDLFGAQDDAKRA